MLVGGVHGLERIGTHIALAFLQHIAERLRWDHSLSALLEQVRLLALPLVNPGGMAAGTRANPRGWDYLYERRRAEAPQARFLPPTLEMGSWLWVRKNQRQLLRTLGPFNPLQPHQHERILRRHHALLTFLLHAAANPHAWTRPPTGAAAPPRVDAAAPVPVKPV